MEHDSENTLRTLISIAQSLLMNEKSNDFSITPEFVSVTVDKALIVLPHALAYRDEAISELIRRFSFWVGEDNALEDHEGHVPWLNSSRKTKWNYWRRYQQWLETALSIDTVDALDASTDRILGLLEDPVREGVWDRRGLVVGHVQSGKTANYSGLICKAADAGYKIIIVLAGLHNNLRSQTQIRLEESFLGYETSVADTSIKLVGVGKIDTDPEIRPNCATNRSNNGDFNTRVARHYAITPEERPWLFVIKKNKTVLKSLFEWIVNHVADSKDAKSGKRFVSSLPLLLIDDEGDHASVDTGEQLFNPDGTPDDEHEPKAINRLIRKILHSFSKKAYVAYTATPFANIFIHRRNETSEEGPDLFPQSFIINLAAPSNYIGPVHLFGARSLEGRTKGLPLIRTISDHVDKDGKGGWMPHMHKKEHVPVINAENTIPPSLQEAVLAFVLSSAARMARGQEREHSSMLIHVTRFNQVQERVHQQVDSFIRLIRQRILRGVECEDLLARMRSLWAEDFEQTFLHMKEDFPNVEKGIRIPSWEALLPLISNVLQDIDVRIINGTAGDVLDYENHSGKGLKVIAIGGDKLSRGLTLQGLSISYFVRTSRMYDTLMQMGRWFGYRPGYLDLCRLYTSADLVEWFEHITDASEILREEFDAMAESGATPREYGLKVESHPVLLVTSPLKMRSAKTLQLSFSGRILETVSYYQDPVVLSVNLDATNSLIDRMGPPSEVNPRRDRGESTHEWKGFLWNYVPAEAIISFFSSYITHPKAHEVNSTLIVKFINEMERSGELTFWTVALLGGGIGGPHVFHGGLKIESMSIRKRNEIISDRYSIGRLLSPRDEAIDLSLAAWKAALEITSRTRNPNSEILPELPNGPSIRRVRGEGAEGVSKSPERGLLLLYPLDPEHAGLSDMRVPVMGFAASFPSSNSGKKVTYKADHLLWETEYGPTD